MKALHLTPDGPGGGITRSERRIARALLGETIRHELAERHATHWPWHRPSSRRILAACLRARRRRLVVVTDHDADGRRVLAAAACATTSARFGRFAAAPLLVLRWCTKGTVIVATILIALGLRDGRVGIGTLFAAGVVTALITAPFIASVRERLGDRVLAAKASLLTASDLDGETIVVLRHLGFPQRIEQPGSPVDWTDLVAEALRSRAGDRRVAQPCCVELAARYARSSGVEWLPQHARVDRTVLVFMPKDNLVTGSTGSEGVISIDTFRSSLQPV